MMRIFTLLIISTLLSSCYSLSQAIHFNNLINSRILIEDVLQDPKTSPKLKDRLVLVKDVVRFAKKSGLVTGDAYTYFIPHEGRSVSHSVKAAFPLQLKFKTWWFPFTGRVPYLGYYSSLDRDRKADELKQEGFDVAKGSIAAFSSLGWFSDPVFSSMIQREKYHLVHLLFHELSHRTIWFLGNVSFNENLAEFIAIKLTSAYIESSSFAKMATQYEDFLSDRKLYHDWLTNLERQLSQLYVNKKGFSEDLLLAKKKAIFEKFKTEELPAFKGEWYKLIGNKDWNNASLLSARLYGSELPRFERAYKCLGVINISQFIIKLQNELGATKPLELYSKLDNLCE